MIQSGPRVGIGLPVYNGEQFLPETLDSLLGQTYGDFLLIIGDNASTDGTEEIAREYQARDPRVRYLRHRRNIGAAANYNELFRRAGTEYFRWHAADDLSLPDYTARCVEALDADPGIALAYCGTTDIDQDGKVLGPYEDNVDARQTSAHDRFAHVLHHLARCNALYGLMRSSLAGRTRLMGSFTGADYVFMAELALYGRFIEVPDRLFRRRYHARASSAMTEAERRTFFSGKRAAPTQHTVRGWWTCWTATLRAPLPWRERARLQWTMVKFAYWWRTMILQEATAVLRYRTLPLHCPATSAGAATAVAAPRERRGPPASHTPSRAPLAAPPSLPSPPPGPQAPAAQRVPEYRFRIALQLQVPRTDRRRGSGEVEPSQLHRMRVTILAELLLPDQAELPVIEHDDDERKLFTGCREQLQAGHRESPVAHQRHDPAAGRSERGADGRGDAEPHRLKVARADEAPRRKHPKMPAGERLVQAGIGDEDGIAREGVAQRPEELLGGLDVGVTDSRFRPTSLTGAPASRFGPPQARSAPRPPRRVWPSAAATPGRSSVAGTSACTSREAG